MNHHAAEMIEAKKDSAGENLTVAESQTERYATANLIFHFCRPETLAACLAQPDTLCRRLTQQDKRFQEWIFRHA